jgi:hypothetical protein
MKDIEKLVVYELSENIRKNKLDSLISQGKSLKEILMHDYFSKDNFEKFESSMINNIVNKEHAPTHWNTKKYFRFKTPKKELILDECKKSISPLLIPKLNELNTKDELKKVYCVDEILSVLNPDRIERLCYSGEMAYLLNSAIESFKNQLIANEMKKVKNEFEKKAEKVNYDNLFFKDLLYIDNISKEILKNSKKTSSDFEIYKVIEDSKEVLERLDQDIKKGIDIRMNKAYLTALNQFNFINEKEFLLNKDILSLKKSRQDLKDIEKMLSHYGDVRNEPVSNSLRKHNLLLFLNEDFKKNKRKFYRTIRNQRIRTEIIKNLELKDEQSFLGFIDTNEIKNYLRKTNDNLNRLCYLHENRYFKSSFKDKKQDFFNQIKSINPIPRWYLKILHYDPDYLDKFSFIGKKYINNLKIEKTKKRKALLSDILSFNERINSEDFL